MLYIDEATSGLDAGTEARMMRLFRRLADEGKSLVCITHNVDNVDQCHLAIVLVRGKVVLLRPTRRGTRLFRRQSDQRNLRPAGPKGFRGVGKAVPGLLAVSAVCRAAPRRDLAANAGPADSGPVLSYRLNRASSRSISGCRGSDYAQSGSVCLSRSCGVSPGRPLLDWPAEVRSLTARALRIRELLVPARNMLHQFWVLTSRYLELVLGDQKGLRCCCSRAPIVALFLSDWFLDKNFRSTVPRTCANLNEAEKKMLHALEVVSDLVSQQGEPTPREKEALEKIRVEVLLGDKGEKHS